jgi:predicted nucleic acid-binding protein
MQQLNEFANVGRRKLGMTWREVRDALAAIRTVCRAILPVDLETMRKRSASPNATATQSSMR